VLPACNSEAMQLHLDEIATKVTPGAHAIVLFDQPGWHAIGQFAQYLQRAGAPPYAFPSSANSRSMMYARLVGSEPPICVVVLPRPVSTVTMPSWVRYQPCTFRSSLVVMLREPLINAVARL
jgi:hypothetical protein